MNLQKACIRSSNEYVDYADDEEQADLSENDNNINSASTLKGKSPFTSAFKNALPSLEDEKDNEGVPNASYCPPAFKVFSDIIHLYPLWSAN